MVTSPKLKKKNLREPNMFDASKWQGSPCYLGFFPSSHSIPMSPSCPHIVSYTPMVYPPVSSNLAAKSHQSTLIFPWNFLEKPLLIIIRWFSMVFHRCPPYFPRFSMVFPICSAQIFPWQNGGRYGGRSSCMASCTRRSECESNALVAWQGEMAGDLPDIWCIWCIWCIWYTFLISGGDLVGKGYGTTFVRYVARGR